MRMTKCTWYDEDGESYRYEIPEMWLAGNTRARIQAGVGVSEAYRNAIRSWHTQAILEGQWLAERGISSYRKASE